MKSIMVIGGGAAGHFGAISAKQHFPNDQVTLIEGTSSGLRKVKISGGGRCNVTHHLFDSRELMNRYPRGNPELLGVFSRFQPKDTVAWFESRGVKLKVESDGRMFPITDSSETIMNCLTQECDRLGVVRQFSRMLESIHGEKDHFRLKFGAHEVMAHRILMATGSHPSGYRLIQSLGHALIDPRPSLFTFEIKDPRIDGLEGLSFSKVKASLFQKKWIQEGPLLITHWGLSGPAILKLSAFAARDLFVTEPKYHASLNVDFLPDLSANQVIEILRETKDLNPRKQVASFSPFPDLPKRFWTKNLDFFSIPHEMNWADISQKKIQELQQGLKSANFQITGKGQFKDEFVTAGGVDLKEVQMKTLESKKVPGIYFAGEILNVDGITGGFNFQNAWSTGFIAGQNIGKDE